MKACAHVIFLAIALRVAFADAAVSLTKLGEKDLGVEGCSGITHVGGDDFYIAQDHDANGNPTLHPVSIAIDRDDGRIRLVQFSAGLKLSGTGDAEGVAYDPCSKGVWVSDESSPPKIQEFQPTLAAANLTARRAAPVPAIYGNCRGNAKLEALTMSRDGLTLWTANEEALSGDGPISSSDNGTVVRLTRFVRVRASDNWTASGQWAYQCDKAGSSLFTSRHQCGLSGLCALPDGSLLALEREVSESTWGRCSVYRLTAAAFAAATDVSFLGALEGASYTKLAKGSALLSVKGKGLTSMLCYEGICPGPQLSEGPSIPAEQGALVVQDGVAVVTPAPGIRRIAVDGGKALTMLVIPPRIEHVSGVPPEKISVQACACDITRAFSLSGDILGVDLALDARGRVVIGDETIAVIPEFAAVSGRQERPLLVSGDAVEIGVRTIPGLVYRLLRTADLANGSEGTAVDTVPSDGVRALLKDAAPPRDAALYTIGVAVE